MGRRGGRLRWVVWVGIGVVACAIIVGAAGRAREGMLNLARPDLRALHPRADEFDPSRVYEYEDFLSADECEAIIEHSRGLVKESTVVCSSTENCKSEARTSRNGFINDADHPVARAISERVERVLGIDARHFEDLQVVHYTPGQEYKGHYDACSDDADMSKCDSTVPIAGQRYATLLIYLNEDFEGGETCFPRRTASSGSGSGGAGPTATEVDCGKPEALKIRPKRGKAALFFNLESDRITARKDSLHAGLPPTSGEKWLCNKWIRTGPIRGSPGGR